MIWRLVLIFTIMAGNAFAAEPAFDRVSKSRTIHCGYYIGPPYFDKDPNSGAFSGINYEVMNAIGKNLDLKIEWVAETGIGDVAAGLGSGKFDAMCAAMWPDPGRVATMSFTQPLFYTPVHLYARADDRRFDGDAAKGNRKSVKISAIDGDFSYNLAKERFPDATLVSLPQTVGVSDVMLQVTTKKADLVMMDQGTANGFSKRNKGALQPVKGVKPMRVYSELLFIGRGEYQLRDMLDSAIEQLKNDGFIADVLKKYNKSFEADYTSPAKDF